MKVSEVIALLQTLPPDAYVSINGQEYHLTGKFEVLDWEDGRPVVVALAVGLGFPDGWWVEGEPHAP